jgi:hypothetical protein
VARPENPDLAGTATDFQSAIHRYPEGSGNSHDAGLDLLNRRSHSGIGAENDRSALANQFFSGKRGAQFSFLLRNLWKTKSSIVDQHGCI